MPARFKAQFISPMLLLKTDTLPQGESWTYQLKLDGYRAIAFKTGGTLHLRSRSNKDFAGRYPAVLKGLAQLPNETVIDGEVVAFDEEGRPSFNALQNYGSSPAPVVYYVFDVMVLAGVDVPHQPLEKRRALLEKKILPKLAEPVRYTVDLDATLPVLIESVKAQGLEGLVAKRLDSRYESGLRSGAWTKMRVNRGQGVRHRWLHTRDQDVRCHRVRVLRRPESDLRRQNPQRLHARDSCGFVQEVQRPGDRHVPIRQSAGTSRRPLGSGIDGGEDEGMHVAQATTGRTDRVSGVDR